MVKREDEKWIARLTYQYPKLEKLSSIIPASSRKSCHEINLRIHDEECKGSLTFGRAFASTVAFGSFAQRLPHDVIQVNKSKEHMCSRTT